MLTGEHPSCAENVAGTTLSAHGRRSRRSCGHAHECGDATHQSGHVTAFVRQEPVRQLAENAGLNPIAIVTELRNRHARGEKTAGINVRKGMITNILEENVVQPLLVSTSAIALSTETVRMILKIGEWRWL